MIKKCESCELRKFGICAVLIGTPPNPESVEHVKHGVIRARQFLQRDGDKAGSIKVIRQGWATSVETTSDGKFLTSEIHVAGDSFGAAFMIEQGVKRNVRAMTDVEYCSFDVSFVKPLLLSRQDVLDIFIEQTADIIRSLRARLLDIGTRTAEQRVISFIVSVHDKLEERGLLKGPKMPFPLRQQDIADALGLTQVHTNRVLKNLREKGAFTIEKKEVYVSDVEKIRAMLD